MAVLTLQETELRIIEVFNRVKSSGMTFGEHFRKDRLSDRTIESYKNVCLAYARHLYDKHGISDISRAKPRHATEFIQDKINEYFLDTASAFSMRRFAHALHALREGSQATGVFKGKLKVGDKRELLGMMNDAGIERKASESRSLMANHDEWDKVHQKIENSRSNNAKTIANIHKIQRYLGYRISETIDAKVSDFTFNSDGSMTARIKGKGGLVRYVTTTEKEIINTVVECIDGKKMGAPVFQIKDQRGNDLSKKDAATRAKQQIRESAKQAKVDRDGKKYTSHSGRKAFAQSQMNGYARMSNTALKREIARRCSSDKNLKRKYDTVMKNIRAHIKEENRSSRHLSHSELSALLVSFDLGHGRLDIVRYYCSYPGKI